MSHGQQLVLDGSWSGVPTALHGGYVVEHATRATLDAGVHPDPLVVSAAFFNPALAGPARVDVELIRAGRSVSALRSRLLQPDPAGDGERPVIDLLVTAGDLAAGGPAAGTLFEAAPAPRMPAPGDCVRTVVPPGSPRNGIVENLEIRFDPSAALGQGGEPSARGVSRAWVRYADGSEADALRLLCIADAMPPLAWDFGIRGWAPTVQITVFVREHPAPGWLRCATRTSLVADGWIDQDCDIWDSRDRLVASSRQLAAYRPPPAAG